MIRSLAIVLVFVATSLAAQQESDLSAAAVYEVAVDSVESDLADALKRLAEVRLSIDAEKPTIAVEANRIAAELREARRQADLAKTSRDAAESEFEKADRDLRAWRDEKSYLETMLLEFRKEYEASIPLSRSLTENTTLLSPTLDDRLTLVESALADLASPDTVSVTSGEALDEDGILVPGSFATIGPSQWFLSKDGKVGGLISDAAGSRPRVTLGSGGVSQIKSLLGG
ncbi:MAG: hypothetical protein AAF368_10460, partial [Planctomycetota bacterium]